MAASSAACCCVAAYAQNTSAGPKPEPVAAQRAFELRILDRTIQEPWLKSVGDLNGDGRPDLIVGGARSGGLVAFYNDYPNFDRVVMDGTHAYSTDGEVADINGDGRNDFVAITYPSGVVWLEQTHNGWKPHPIVNEVWHDVEVADLDGDGLPDLVGRNQKEWPSGKDAGNILHLCWQRREHGAVAWDETTMPCPPGEGLLVADVDGDGRPDIIVNQRWYQNLGHRQWAEHTYAADADWNWPNTFIALGDINGDGRADIVLSPSELAGHHYKVSWFEAPVDRTAGPWREHTIVPHTETVLHFIGAADFDGDGRVDVATAHMPQGADPDDVTVYFNRGVNRSGRWVDRWAPLVISHDGSHSMRIVDLDGDGRPDLFGANWTAGQGRDDSRSTTGCDTSSTRRDPGARISSGPLTSTATAAKTSSRARGGIGTRAGRVGIGHATRLARRSTIWTPYMISTGMGARTSWEVSGKAAATTQDLLGPTTTVRAHSRCLPTSLQATATSSREWPWTASCPAALSKLP